MNHIHRLQSELEAARNKLRAMEEMLCAFQVHLMSKKLQGYQTDGQRKDWIVEPQATTGSHLTQRT
jgi:hypothetical protein